MLIKIMVFVMFAFAVGPIQAAVISDSAPETELRELLKQAIKDNTSFGDRYEAEVWFSDMTSRLSKKVKNTEERIQLLKLIHAEARRVDLPPELVLAVIEVESNFDRWAISKAGARGLMQVMPFWLNEIGKPSDNLFNTHTNLRMGCTILRFYLDKERGNLIRALGRYNGSLGRYEYPDKVLTALRTKWYRP